MITSKVSIIIPSYRDPYLNKTLESILNESRENIEIIVFLDHHIKGSVNKIKDKRVKYLFSKDNIGMRTAINRSVDIATGKYLMKIDSHCNIGVGFDVILKKGSEENAISIPSRYNLNIETWDKFNGPIDYLYLVYPVDMDRSIRFRSKVFKKRKKESKMIDDIISFQGSCWFMEKSFFNKIGGLDVNMFGSWGSEAHELSMKAWLCNNGKVVRNRNIWYSHYSRDKILMKSMRDNLIVNSKKVFSMCMCDSWPKQNKPFKWLVDNIGPFPKWPNNWNSKENISILKEKGYIDDIR